MKLHHLLLLLVLVTSNIFAQNNTPIFKKSDTQWADSVFSTMNLDEKIAQCINVAAYSNRDENHVKEISQLVKKHNVGGVIFFQGDPVSQAIHCNKYQSVSKVPLLISIDGEWGLSMRLDSTIRYPRQMMLGAINDEINIYEMGRNIASQLKRLGIHVNFAPVIDINNNANNPVINSRSFGEEKHNVTLKGYSYMLGMQDNNILAVAKHFPGHGDTNTDSHYALPVVNHSISRLDSLELYPFNQLIKYGIGGIMVAHMSIPSLDPIKNHPSTLSPEIVTDLLKGEMAFKGLVFTDAMNMKGLTPSKVQGEVGMQAFLAGNDILLMPENVSKTITRIKRAVKKGEISEQDLNQRVKKILYAKQWVGLDNYKPIETKNLVKDLNSPIYEVTRHRLVASAITLLENKNNIIPIKKIANRKIAAISIGNKELSMFQRRLSDYADVDFFNIERDAPEIEFSKLMEALKDYDLSIIGVNNTDQRPSRNFGITDKTVNFIAELSSTNSVIVDIFGNPYSLAKFKHLDKLEGLLMSYEDTELANDISAQIIFGAFPAIGYLPITATEKYSSGYGIVTNEAIRMKFTTPEEAGLDSKKLQQIDKIVNKAIAVNATPGCQILVAKNGRVVYNKSFGHHTYNHSKKVQNSDIYDIASITKISTTLPLLMKMTDDKVFNINHTLGNYLSSLNETDKGDLVMKDILCHTAQLYPWIPFYRSFYTTLIDSEELYSTKQSIKYPFHIDHKVYMNKNYKFKDGIFSTTKSDTHSVKVADAMYMASNYTDTVYKMINESTLLPERGYKYSDLGYYYFKKIIEIEYEGALDVIAQNELYSSLGMQHTTFNPNRNSDKFSVIPTENDIVFRKQLINGYVHDQGSALLGGVCGHAGLFTNATDLAKLMMMYNNGGTYGGIRYISDSTLALFTSSPFLSEGNRRGIGFDKPETDPKKVGPTCDSAPATSFGHTGFTGTMAWVDPVNNIVYIFLSNRIYPDADNTKLIKMDVRTDIQEAIYDAIIF